MQCSQCGSMLPQEARFCSRCGAVVMVYQPPVMPPPGFVPGGFDAFRVTRNIQALALLWAVYAVYRFVTKVFGLTIFHSWMRHSRSFDWGGGGDWWNVMMPVAITALVLSTALSLLAAYGLSTRAPWGRTAAIVCAIWSLLHPVLGTVLGIYTLWVFVPAASGAEYERLIRPQGQAPGTL